MPEHDNVDRASGICALRSLFGDSLAPGARAGWPSSLGMEGRQTPARRGKGAASGVARRSAPSLTTAHADLGGVTSVSPSVCKVRLLQSLPLC